MPSRIFTKKQICFILILKLVLSGSHGFNVNPLKIPPKVDEYEFWLNLDTQMTMMEVDENGRGNVFLWDFETQKLMKRLANIDDEKPCDALKAENDGSRIMVGDGLHREYIAVNGQLPGPSLVVYEGAEVIVHVKNNLASREVALHFHGMLQNGTFWSDGAAMVSQCPIRPGETFTHRFKAEPAGTTYYHGHFVADRGDGLYGAFIVLPPDYETPDVQDFPVVLADWFKNQAEHEYTYSKWGIGRFYPGFENLDQCYKESRTFDYSIVGQFKWHSALINGRGWHNAEEMETAPLSEFKTNEKSDTVFRLVHGGINFPFLFSITEHFLNITHVDGAPITPVIADALIIYPGERFDVFVVPRPDRKCTICGIFASSVEFYTGAGENFEDASFVMAKLVYELEEVEEPTIVLEHTNNNPVLPVDISTGTIKVFNCPYGPEFTGLPSKSYSCIDFNTVTSPNPQESAALAAEFPENELKEIFLSVYRDTDLNGVKFVYPVAPPALFSEDSVENYTTPCPVDSNGLPIEGSVCTQTINLQPEIPVQIVLYNRGKHLEDPKELDAFAHPIHIHGTHFCVVKIGYPEYASDGTISKFNDDISCPEHSEQCNSASWSNQDWVGGKVPGLNLKNPVTKDTVTVPVGGYVVIRLVPPSAGWWLMHCHFMPHHLDGMALLFKVGTESDLPSRPPGFPMCYNYDATTNVSKETESKKLSLWKTEFAAVIVGSCIAGFLVGAIIGFAFKRKRYISISAEPILHYSSTASN